MSALRHSWVLAVVGALGVVIAGSIFLVQGELGGAGQVFGVLGVLGLLGYGVIDRERIAAGASTREVFASASAGAILAMALLVGVLGYTLVDRWDQTYDLTRDGRYSLSSRSRALVGSFEEPVQIYGFFVASTAQAKRFERLGELYASASDQVTYHAVDPLRQPAQVRALLRETGNEDLDRLAASGAVFLVQGDRTRRIESGFDQTRITNALAKLQSGDDHRVCWSVGHGERVADDDQSRHGYGVLVLRLEDRNAVVVEQNLFTSGIDRSCQVLVIAGPRKDFHPRSLEALAAYLAEGGQVLLLLDSPLLKGVETPNLDQELERYGLRVGHDAIIETRREHLANLENQLPLYYYDQRQFKSHPVLDDLGAGIVVRWPRSVIAVDEVPTGISVRELAASSDRSWAETTFDPTQEPTPDEGELQGPVPFMSLAEVLLPDAIEVLPPPSDPDGDPAAEDPILATSTSLVPDDLSPKEGGRLLVIGDADLGGNDLSTLLNNGDLLLSAISYLIGDDGQIGTDEVEDEFLLLSTTQFALIFLIGILLVPGSAVAIGGFLVVRRRFL
ncbi:MAG: hypothetical protein EA397_18225 [Deltaproteobacteria bacterium]|nr:MAG: hypothetical protein EA397_18225 [Deltaproteobacteria bacterium]